MEGSSRPQGPQTPREGQEQRQIGRQSPQGRADEGRKRGRQDRHVFEAFRRARPVINGNDGRNRACRVRTRRRIVFLADIAPSGRRLYRHGSVGLCGEVLGEVGEVETFEL